MRQGRRDPSLLEMEQRQTIIPNPMQRPREQRIPPWHVFQWIQTIPPKQMSFSQMTQPKASTRPRAYERRARSVPSRMHHPTAMPGQSRLHQRARRLRPRNGKRHKEKRSLPRSRTQTQTRRHRPLRNPTSNRRSRTPRIAVGTGTQPPEPRQTDTSSSSCPLWRSRTWTRTHDSTKLAGVSRARPTKRQKPWRQWTGTTPTASSPP
mmetsp:Transcript_17267/g.39704  ORF Transcript_17267/g.39704 Transcript_17267/m.39704 type:complete len:207 (-) Transcript_17267:313-933(-)